ncbi:MAG: HD domain-containing protein [Clostridia bacterium]|nr:HD domain-containing protein [Clostridia bacterium]
MTTNEKILDFNDYKFLLDDIEQKLKDYIVKNFDIKDDNINLKYIHTSKVKLVNDTICESLNLEPRDFYLSGLIALFHDYSRFEQFKTYSTYSDLKSIDHANLAVQRLFDEGEFDNFVDNVSSEEKSLIYKAIKNHNKFAMDPDLTERELLFCNIIRDADKLDIFRILCEDPQCCDIEKGKLTEEELENFYNHKLYKKTTNVNFYNRALLHFSMIYDLNFKISFEIMFKEQYLKKYFYSLVLWANFKIGKKLMNCFDYIQDYIKEKIEE